MEDQYKKLLEYLNAEGKKGADRNNTILDLRRFFAGKKYSICVIGENDELFVNIAAFERQAELNWLSTNENFDWFKTLNTDYTRYNVDVIGCLELFIKPHDVIIIQMNVAVNHKYPERIVSRFLNMARIKCFVLNSYKAFDVNGKEHDGKEIIERVLAVNSEKFKRTRNIQRSNGWTEFERKEPITNKRFDIL